MQPFRHLWVTRVGAERWHDNSMAAVADRRRHKALTRREAEKAVVGDSTLLSANHQTIESVVPSIPTGEHKTGSGQEQALPEGRFYADPRQISAVIPKMYYCCLLGAEAAGPKSPTFARKATFDRWL